MNEQAQRIKEAVTGPATALTRASHEIARLNRRREFEADLKKHGNWLANGPADAPAWVTSWNEYWERLGKDPAYLALREEEASARATLHSTDFEAAIERLRLGEPGEPADWAIAYLEADPWYFRSGYFKARLSRWLRQIPLDEDQKNRLRAVILANLSKGPRFDFTETRRLGRRLDAPEFRSALERLVKHPDLSTADRAGRLLAACLMNGTQGRDLRGAR